MDVFSWTPRIGSCPSTGPSCTPVGPGSRSVWRCRVLRGRHLQTSGFCAIIRTSGPCFVSPDRALSLCFCKGKPDWAAPTWNLGFLNSAHLIRFPLFFPSSSSDYRQKRYQKTLQVRFGQTNGPNVRPPGCDVLAKIVNPLLARITTILASKILGLDSFY